MKSALLVLLFCVVEADDVRWEVNDKIQKLKSSLEERLSNLEAQNADMAAKLSASEKNTEQLQTSYDQLQTSFDRLQDRHNLLTNEQGCLKKKLSGNVARGGQAAQSSVYPPNPGPPERAIDGCRATVYTQNCCTHTSAEANPWWRVDLHNTYNVNSVRITNRGDCCAERINGAEIRIGNSLNDNGNGNPRCAVIDSIPAGGTRIFECAMVGQFVNIVIPGQSRILTLCEVEVSGTLKDGC